MAISAINISQDNKVGSSNLMPVHSPLVFIADVTYSGAIPTVVYARLYDINDNLIDSFKSIPFEDPLATVRTFLFDSALFIRAQMESLEDEFQLAGTITYISAPVKQFKISFYDSDSLIESTKLTISAIAGASQFGQYPNLADIYNNLQQTYIAKVGSFVYVYYYNGFEDTNLQITDDGSFIGGFTLSEIGYHRYKTLVTDSKIVNFVDDGGLDVDHNITSQGCANDALLKYLDKTGQYRYFNFNEFYETRDNSKSIGSIEKLITNIRTDQSSRTQIGKASERTISLIAEVENDQLSLLSDLVQSPKVYLYIGTLTSDTVSDWLEVEVLTNDSLIRRRIGTSGRADVTIKLPNIYNVTLL